MSMARTSRRGRAVRGLPAPGPALALAIVAWVAGAVAATPAAGPPRDPDGLVQAIREAIETKDYEAFRELVFWKDAGKIKRRVVRFEINRGLGRPIRSITFEPFPENGMDGVIATGRLIPNMEVTNRVRVIYDEPPTPAGKPPTAVFLVGKIDDAYRIGLVVRKPGFDDDDD